MDPVTMIVTALTLGSIEIAKGALGEAGEDIFQNLKTRVLNAFEGDLKAKHALEHLDAPDSDHKPLRAALEHHKISGDSKVLEAAKTLLSLVDPMGTRAGKYSVQVSGGQGVIVGDGNQQTNTFN